MITKDNEPIVLMIDGGYQVQHGPNRYCVRESDIHGVYKVSEIVAYLAEHNLKAIPEPKPPELSAEEKVARKALDDEAKEAELDRKWVREQRKKAEKNGDK